MDDVTRILNAIRGGEVDAGNELMAAVYQELRKMAAAKMVRERLGQTIQPTALVHEAWMRLGEQTFESRGHFFVAAAEAMRRILIDRARRKNRDKRGGAPEHLDVAEVEIAAPLGNENEAMEVDGVLDQLAAHDARKAEVVKLRYFVGCSFEETASLLGISVPTAKRDWAYSRAWLRRELAAGP